MDPRDRLFGEIAVRLQLLTREQVSTCIHMQNDGDAGRVGEIAVQLGFIGADEAELIVTHQQRILQRRRRPASEGTDGEASDGRRDPRAGSGRPTGEISAPRKRRAREWEAASAPADGNIQVPSRAANRPPMGDAAARAATAPPAPAAPMDLAETRPDPLPEEQPPTISLADTAPGEADAPGRPAVGDQKQRKANRWQAAAAQVAPAVVPLGAAGGTMMGAGPSAAGFAAAPSPQALAGQAPGVAPGFAPTPAAAPVPARAPANLPDDVEAFPTAEGDDRADVGTLEAREPPPRAAAAAPTAPTHDQASAFGGTMLGAAPSAQQVTAAAAAGATAAAGGIGETQEQRAPGSAGGTMFGGFAGNGAAAQPAPSAPVAGPPPPAAHSTPAATAPRPSTPDARDSSPDGSSPLAKKRKAAAANPSQTYLGKALKMAMQQGASDLHAHSGAPIMLRIDGVLRPLGNSALAPEAAEKVIAEIMTEEQWDHLRATGELDFAYAIPGLGRFRVNVYRQQRGLDVVFRLIPERPPTLKELGLPERLSRLTDYRTGMVLCTGPAGCGKSSTLAALIDLLIHKRSDHILTIEDPVEYVFPAGSALVNQRQVGDHTNSFARALRAALREDPDIIAITELRDRETMSLAISAAETGHLVLGTLHTGNAGQTISRIINAFPADEQEQVRAMLSESLRAVVSQRLVPKQGGGRVPALELLMVNTAVSNLIRDDKTHQLPSVMQTGKAAGMITLDDSLKALVDSGKVTKETARRFAVRKERFN